MKGKERKKDYENDSQIIIKIISQIIIKVTSIIIIIIIIIINVVMSSHSI